MGNRRVAKLSPLRWREKQPRSLAGRDSDFKEHRHLVSPGREFPLVAGSQHDILVANDQRCGYRFDLGVLEITQPDVVAFVTDGLGGHLEIARLP